MSLVNDALKRARQLQEPSAANPVAGPALRPAESGTNGHRELGLLLSAALGGIAVLLFLLGGLALLRNYASSRAQPAPAEVPTSIQVGTVKTPVVPAPPPEVAAEPARLASLSSVATSRASNSVARATTLTNAPGPLEAATNPPSAEPAAPKTAPLKLQAIILNPRRPSALISGKTVFVGDRIGEWRVIALGADSAKLAGPAGTKVLYLE